MADALRNSSSEPTSVDTAASAACTRSGAFGLLLTVALSLLIPYWMQRRNEVALGNYIAYRANLANQIETLDDNPPWKEYKDSNKTAESLSIAELMKVSVESPKIVPEIKAQTNTSSAAAQPKIQHDPNRWTPSPPADLSVHMTAKLDVMIPIADSLNRLNDSDLLSRSRVVSNFFEFSIVRWVNKRSNLIYENMTATNCCTKQQHWEIWDNTQQSAHFVPELDKDALLNCLALRDVRVLAQFELPTFSNPVQSEGRIEREVDINPSSLMPRGLYISSVLVQLLLFFVIVHFGAFAGEAVSSAGFPVQGTLFSAFSGSRGTLLVFLLALWSPLFASMAVAVTARKWSLVPYSLLIGCAILFAHLRLQRKSYFRALNPRLINALVSKAVSIGTDKSQLKS
jgi:hypothetical protein